jgi:hypothetical protein
MRLRSASWTGGLAATAIAAGLLALPVSALAATGASRLTLDGPAASALRKQGVRIKPLSPAHGGPRQISLPVGAGLAGSRATLLRQRGGISLAGPDGARVRLTGLTVLLGGRSRVTARLGGRGIDLFRIQPGGRRDIDAVAGTVDLEHLRLELTPGAARTLAARLAVGFLPASRFATLFAKVSKLTSGTGEPPSEGGTTLRPTGCAQPSGAGPTPEVPLGVAVRPPGAIDVTSATLDWHVRESFIQYIASGEGTRALNGATADPPVLLPGGSAPLSYDFHFPFASGWLDPGPDLVRTSDDSAAIDFSGALRFHYSGHEIDLTTASPEIEIDGARSRAIFAISDSGGAPRREVLVNLDLSRAATVKAGSGSYVYEGVPGAVPPGTASSVFAGFYTPGTPFGCFTVAFGVGS